MNPFVIVWLGLESSLAVNRIGDAGTIAGAMRVNAFEVSRSLLVDY
jgi:hypothetical protein